MILEQRIKLSTILFYISLTCIVSYAFLENVTISIEGFSVYKRPLLIVAGLCLLNRIQFFIRQIQRKKYFFTMIVLVFFIITTVYSAYENRWLYSGHNPMSATINLALFLIELFLIMIYAAENRKQQQVFEYVFFYALILTIVTDFIMFSGVQRYTDGSFETYLVGTKFSVVYMHIYLVAFFLVKLNNGEYTKKSKWKQCVLIVIGAIIIVLVSLRVDCNTGIIGSLLLLFFVCFFNIFSDSWFRKFTSPKILFVFILACTIIAFVFETIVQYPTINYLITEVLNRSSDLTGRTEIFALYTVQMKEHWLWGYGMGSSYRTSMNLFGYADAQNALLQWILQIGVIPVFFLLIFFMRIFRKLSQTKNKIGIIPIIALIYTFIVLGSVEITYSMNFVLWMGLAFMYANQKEFYENSDFINAENC